MDIPKKFIILIAALAVVGAAVLGGTLAYLNNQNSDDHEYHAHAGFVVFVDGVKQDYSGTEFMHLGACSAVVERDLSDVKERVHLHDNLGNVAHIHAEGVVWRELFESLELDLAFDPLPVMFVNDENAPDLLEREIGNHDSAVFIFGTADDVDALRSQAATEADIEYAESIVESCGKG